MTSAPYIRTGALKSYAELQSKSKVEDDIGGHSTVWATERRIWCHIRPVSGSQKLENMRRESKVTHEIYVRHQDDVDPEVVTVKRIQLETASGTRFYNIVAAWLPQEFSEFVHMIAERGAKT